MAVFSKVCRIARSLGVHRTESVWHWWYVYGLMLRVWRLKEKTSATAVENTSEPADSGDKDDDELDGHILRLIEERDSLLRTGVYSHNDRVVADLEQQIRKAESQRRRWTCVTLCRSVSLWTISLHYCPSLARTAAASSSLLSLISLILALPPLFVMYQQFYIFTDCTFFGSVTASCAVLFVLLL